MNGNTPTPVQRKRNLLWVWITLGAILFLSGIAVFITLINNGIGGVASSKYIAVVEESEKLFNEARSLVPSDSIIKEDIRVKDLETSQHRLSCGSSTSQYSNRTNIWLTAGNDGVAIVNTIRDHFLSQGWTRLDSVADRANYEDKIHQQILRDPQGKYGYGLTISRGDDNDGTSILQIQIYSPCVKNPTDKPKTWGKF